MSKYNLKILLVSIGRGYKYSNAGLDLLTGYLRRKDYRVDIMYFHMKESIEEIINSLPLTYSVYGFSVDQSNYLYNMEIANYLKNKGIDNVVWGGAFPSMYYKDILDDVKAVDYIILGDGEKPFEYLLEQLLGNKKIEHESIASINDFENKKNAINGMIDYFPVDDYYKTVEVEKNVEKIHCIQTKNNICTGNCSFCFERKGKIAYKDLDIIVAEIEYIHKNYGVRKFFFSDDNLLDPNNDEAKKRVMRMCELIANINAKLVFTCYIKANSFENSEYDNKLLKKMREVGFVSMFIGIESGNNEDLILYNKFTTVEDNIRIIELLTRNDIIPLTGFININPYSTRSKLKENYYFLTSINSNNLFSFAGSFLQLSKGTKIYEYALRDNLISKDYSILEGYDYDFYDEEIKPIALFVKNELKPRLLSLPVETSWLFQRVKECTVYCDGAKKFLSRLKEIKEQEVKIIQKYFYYLFVEGDVNFCKNNLAEFFEYFEALVPELEMILCEINKMKYGERYEE